MVSVADIVEGELAVVAPRLSAQARPNSALPDRPLEMSLRRRRPRGGQGCTGLSIVHLVASVTGNYGPAPTRARFP